MTGPVLYNTPAVSGGSPTSAPALVDPLASDPVRPMLLRMMPPSNGGRVNGADNAWGYSIQFVLPPTNSPADYERAGMIVQFRHGDPSQYGAEQVTRDGVGIEVQGTAATKSSRVWAFDCITYFPANTHGYGVFFEGSLYNQTPDVPDPNDTAFGKYGANFNSVGPTPGTAALAVRGMGGQWHHGFYADPNSVTPDGAAIRLDNKQGAGIQLAEGVAIVAVLPNGSKVDVGYVNAERLLVLGGPGLAGVAIWNGQSYTLQS